MLSRLPSLRSALRGLDSARLAARVIAAAWPENGLGPVVGRTCGAPAGRGVAPCTRVPLRT